MAVNANTFPGRKKKIEWMKDGLLWLYESLILVDLLLGQGIQEHSARVEFKEKGKRH